MKFTAPTDFPILEALQQLSPGSSKNTLRSWIKEGRVLSDGLIVKNTSHIVLKGETIAVGPCKKLIRPGVPLLYEDGDLAIVIKPSGLLSVATAFEKGETLHALLKAYYHPKTVFPVQRLDQDTSGVMVFALNQESRERLKKLFEVHAIERSYTAIVEGRVSIPKGTWKSYQYEDPQYKVHETDDKEKGRLSITHFRSIASSKNYTCLELSLETGRKNQIRVHCSSAGCPVAGDAKYGAKTNPIKRLCLHAHHLSFEHPFSKKRMDFKSAVPEEFYKLVPSLAPSNG